MGDPTRRALIIALFALPVGPRSDIIKPVSRTRELESELKSTERQLRLLQKISRYMVRDMSLAEAFQGVVSLVVEFMHCDSCLLYLLQSQELVLCASNNPQPETIGRVRLAPLPPIRSGIGLRAGFGLDVLHVSRKSGMPASTRSKRSFIV